MNYHSRDHKVARLGFESFELLIDSLKPLIFSFLDVAYMTTVYSAFFFLSSYAFFFLRTSSLNLRREALRVPFSK